MSKIVRAPCRPLHPYTLAEKSALFPLQGTVVLTEEHWRRTEHLHTTQRSSPLPPSWRILSQIQLRAGDMHLPSLLSAKTSQGNLLIQGVRDITLPEMVGSCIQGFISETGEETGEPQDSPCFFWGTSSSAKTSLEQSLSLRRTRNMTLMSKVLQFCRLSKGSWRYKNTNLMES